MADQWKSLGRKLRDTYRQSASDDGPTDEDIRAAFSTLGSAWDRLAGAFGTAIRDEQVRQNAKRAATGFFEAVGAAFSELGSELRRSEVGREPNTSNDAPNSYAEEDEANPGRGSEP